MAKAFAVLLLALARAAVADAVPEPGPGRPDSGAQVQGVDERLQDWDEPWDYAGADAGRGLSQFSAFWAIEWEPSMMSNPPGAAAAGIGDPVLFAGLNYTSWTLFSYSQVDPGGRLLLVAENTHSSAAWAGLCRESIYNVIDKLPPLDGSVDIPSNYSTALYQGGISFSQGGIFKLCYSMDGTFGIGAAQIVPIGDSTYRIYGAYDSCPHGPRCLAERRFFCHAPHDLYVHYLPQGTECYVFMQGSTTPLLFSAITWMAGHECGHEVGDGMELWNSSWARPVCQEAERDENFEIQCVEVDPLANLYLGKTRHDLTAGFRNYLCYCPGYLADPTDPTNGICQHAADFVQQVGILDVLMVSFADVTMTPVAQIVPMTRFSIVIDCGSGPWCADNDVARIKVVDRDWDPVNQDTDVSHWVPQNTCPDLVEASAWYLPHNCIDLVTGQKVASPCLLPGGNETDLKVFGRDDTRFLPKLDSNNIAVAQIFDVCFVHNPLEIDGIDGATYDTASDDALQNASRLFWKLGQLVVEPLLIRTPIPGPTFVMNRPGELRVGPPDTERSSSTHFINISTSPGAADGFGATANDSNSSNISNDLNGSNDTNDTSDISSTSSSDATDEAAEAGPILKFVEDIFPSYNVDNRLCGLTRPRYFMNGLSCSSASSCSPRAAKNGTDFVLNGGNPEHRLNFRRAGNFAVCYCEAWPEDPHACENPIDWVLVGKLPVAGPIGKQEWLLDIGLIQSIELRGYGFTDNDRIRILSPGENCSVPVYLEHSVEICHNGGLYGCYRHGLLEYVSNDLTYDPDNDEITNIIVQDEQYVYVENIEGFVRRHNSTNPASYIDTIFRAADGQSFVQFVEVPVLDVGDTLHVDENVRPLASHWVRQRDLARIVKGDEIGHRITELRDAGRQARIPLSLDPFPPLEVSPVAEGRWYRSNKLKVPRIRGTAIRDELPVCWSPDGSDYYAEAGHIRFAEAHELERATIGLTTTASQTSAPIVITFWTNRNSRYWRVQNPTQLRVTFQNTAVLAPVRADANAGPMPGMIQADEMHEASQAVCGLLFKELSSEDSLGFPVPRGCYADLDYHDTGGIMQSFYILFEALNGLAQETEYRVVVNARLGAPTSLADYEALPRPLVEIAVMEDIFLRPDGVIDVGYANPDKPIVQAASRAPGSLDERFIMDDRGGINLFDYVTLGEDRELVDAQRRPEDDFVKVTGDTFGLGFLLRGHDVGQIRGGSILRLYFWPLTAWSFDMMLPPSATCTPQDQGHVCGAFSEVSYEAANSICIDFVPPGEYVWLDSKGRQCTYYENPGKCDIDGETYTPENGFSALYSCCTCPGGGRRANANILRLRLPSQMDPVHGSEIIHTIRFAGSAPLPRQGIFATRIGAQISNLNNSKPDYTVSTGRYILKESQENYVSPVGTLVGIFGWGNNRMFKADPILNDFYLGLRMPMTLYSAPPADGSDRSLASLEVALPVGYECRHALPALPIEVEHDDHARRLHGDHDDDDDHELMYLPVFSDLPPSGNGGLPASTSAAGGNASAPGVGFAAGNWRFEANKCIFDLSPNTAMFSKQSYYLHLFALNPQIGMPTTDPVNFWTIKLSSSGGFAMPAGQHNLVCPREPPSNCSEMFYVNSQGSPPDLRNWRPLFPNETALDATVGPIVVEAVPGDLRFAASFAVLGIVNPLVVQPSHFAPGMKNTFQIWFVPDMGNLRGGLLGIRTPMGFWFGDRLHPCVVRDLPSRVYRTYAPPGADGGPRVWPLIGFGQCERRESPRWAPGGVYIVIQLTSALISGRYYGFEVEVTNPSVYDTANHTTDWQFKVDISDGQGFGRDGTYDTAMLHAGEVEGVRPWMPYGAGLSAPVMPIFGDLRPFVFTGLKTLVQISPIQIGINLTANFRITAPVGYEWAWETYSYDAMALTFVYQGIPLSGGGATSPMPGGIPELPETHLHIIKWESYDRYLAGVSYGFRTLIKVPSMPPRTSGNNFFFEWAYNVSGPMHGAAGQAPGPEVRVLRAAKVEHSSTLEGDIATVWMYIETITPIGVNGSIEVELPYPHMAFHNYTDAEGIFLWIDVVEYFGSAPLPPGLRCRRVYYETGQEDRLQIYANISGIEPGFYVFEFNVTNPAEAAPNPQDDSSPCGYEGCYSFFTMKDYRPLAIPAGDEAIAAWVGLASTAWVSSFLLEREDWVTQQDYWTTIPARRITTPMRVAGIVNLTLDERLAAARDDRDGQRSALVFAMSLDTYTPTDDDEIYIRAPVGWHFDSVCDFWTESFDVYPTQWTGQGGRPAVYQHTADSNTTVDYPVEPWPPEAVLQTCRGDGHTATIRLLAGILPGRTYMFRIGVRQNPLMTPLRNTWSVTYGAESSGPIPGFPVWTFTVAELDPISYQWTDPVGPEEGIVAILLRTTNWLYEQQIHGFLMKPMIRVIMPPQFEVVVTVEEQDIQGGRCFAVLMEVSAANQYEVPFPIVNLRCARETNRKNVAEITLENTLTMSNELSYKLWITVYQPHIMSARELPPRTWLIESFLGYPVPPAQAPDGYWLDRRTISGYHITEMAHLHVQVPTDQNASANIAPLMFTMTFADELMPGDEIELVAPPGYVLHMEIRGIIVTIVCNGFQWAPVLWPMNITEEMEEDGPVRPPPRGILPPAHPSWVGISNWTLQLPLRFNASSGETVEMKFIASGLPAWALPRALVLHQAANWSVQGYDHTLALQVHCLSSDGLTGSFDWTDMPEGTSLMASLGDVVNTSNYTNCTDPVYDAGIGSCDYFSMEQNGSMVSDTEELVLFCLNATVTTLNGTNATNASNGANITQDFEIIVETYEFCQWKPFHEIPTQADAVAVKALPCAGNQSDCSSIIEAMCNTPGDVRLQVLWHSPTNLTQELEDYRVAREAALRQLSWDTFPLQATPTCYDERMTFPITADNIHPEREWVNRTAFRFHLGFQAPRRSPKQQENFWLVKHYRNGSILSSDAYRSWDVMSKLRYMRIELMNEVLRPTDPAVLHIEFVTVNPAKRLHLLAESPLGFSFSSAYILEDGILPDDSRRLLWQGFTSDVVMEARNGPEAVMRVTLTSVQYVRIRIGGVILPWIGGQALFTIFTSGSFSSDDEVADELYGCCPPGFPPDNPGEVFVVPSRFQNLMGSLTNYYQKRSDRFPFAASMENRYNEDSEVFFTFNLNSPYRAEDAEQDMIVAIRPPRGSEILNQFFRLQDSGASVRDNDAGEDIMRILLNCNYYDEATSPWNCDRDNYVRQRSLTRTELALPDIKVMETGIQYRLAFGARTAIDNYVREDDGVWVIEIRDAGRQGPAMNLGAFPDFDLLYQVNFSIVADRAPPVVDIIVSVTLFTMGYVVPNRVDVYAPAGYKFLMDCLVPNQNQLDGIIASCRERFILFQNQYLSGAVLLTMDAALTNETLPLTVNLLVKTPAETPPINNWYVRMMDRFGPLAWGVQLEQFVVTPMEAAVSYSAIGGTVVPMFVSLMMRFPMPWNGYLHIAGPRLYQLLCPVTTVFSPRDPLWLPPPLYPSCSSEDPVLLGCLGLPAPGDPQVLQGLPACDPLHELILRFDHIEGSNSSDAIAVGTPVELAIEGRVPLETPRPRSQNVFRVRVLDANKRPIDGKLNYYTSDVRQEPRVQGFQLWHEPAEPERTIQVAIEFTFNKTIGRNNELPGERLQIIEIEVPSGFEVAVQAPQDVRPLAPSSTLVITEWNWTTVMPRQLWFGLDTDVNVTGRFHYMFPVTAPEIMPFNNLWTVKFCADAPYCVTELLSVPIPGFYFGEQPNFELPEGAALAGGALRCSGAPLPLGLFVLLLLCSGRSEWDDKYSDE